MMTRSTWLVSPTFDLCFVANLLWPLALIPTLGDGPTAPLVLWQLYFVTTPHRWITLFLVVTDSDRVAGRGRLFLSIAFGFALLIAGLGWWTGGLGCLIVLDMAWNAWHFGSQHAGVLRIYTRKAGGGWAGLERHGLRWFILYVGLRVPTNELLQLEAYPVLAAWLARIDWAILAVPLLLVGTNLADGVRGRAGKWCYLFSVATLYSTLLMSIQLAPSWTVGLALASAIFHATEYLAIVTYYAWQRTTVGSAGLFRTMAKHWLVVLTAFALGLALFAATVGTWWADAWLTLNLFAAYLHYAYDGLIWKLRQPATATALGVTS